MTALASDRWPTRAVVPARSAAQRPSGAARRRGRGRRPGARRSSSSTRPVGSARPARARRYLAGVAAPAVRLARRRARRSARRPGGRRPGARRARSARQPCTSARTPGRTAAAATRQSRRPSRDGRRWSAPASPYAVAPGAVRNRTGAPYQVFTPFLRAWLEHGWRAARRRPGDGRVGRTRSSRASCPPSPTSGRSSCRRPASRRRCERWQAFLDDRARAVRRRARPARSRRHLADVGAPASTARSTRARCWPTCAATSRAGADAFRTELAWREFYADVLGTGRSRRAQSLRPSSAGMAVRRAGRDGVRRLVGRAAPATRSSTPACVSCSPRAGCTTGCGWSSRRSWSRTCTSSGRAARGTSCDRLRDGDLASNHHGWQWVGRHRHRRGAVLPDLQPGRPGAAVRPGRRLRAALGARAAAPRRQGRPRAVGAPDGSPHGYPERIVDHAVERAEALARFEAVRTTDAP